MTQLGQLIKYLYSICTSTKFPCISPHILIHIQGLVKLDIELKMVLDLNQKIYQIQLQTNKDCKIDRLQLFNKTPRLTLLQYVSCCGSIHRLPHGLLNIYHVSRLLAIRWLHTFCPHCPDIGNTIRVYTTNNLGTQRVRSMLSYFKKGNSSACCVT